MNRQDILNWIFVIYMLVSIWIMGQMTVSISHLDSILNSHTEALNGITDALHATIDILTTIVSWGGE